ncbi:Hypothetical predicted protein [Paramuricea clavata]|uniref:Uncharacterized protein n=1 Tax=Paramuricea clavata TaxID=317549 RepID=A0A6S7HDJ3_PARCT|nr:Hypothetical predicted protein [Paramuricea clavata]
MITVIYIGNKILYNGGDGGDDGEYTRRLRRRVRRVGVRRQAGQGVLGDMENLTFRKIEDHLTIISGQLVLPAQTGGTEQAMIQHLWALSDRAALHPQSISFLIHLNVAKQCHTIACGRRLHISRWIALQRQDNRENPEWNRQFTGSLPNDVLLLWQVFRMPCLQLLEIGYAASYRPHRLKDIVCLCQQLVNDCQPLRQCVLIAQEQLQKYVIQNVPVG